MILNKTINNMKKPITTLSIAIILLAIVGSNKAHSQKPVFEFGKVTMSDIDIEKYKEKYPNEEAVVIGDIGNCSFRVNEKGTHFQFVYTRTARILILDKMGLDYGNLKIPYYQTSEKKDKIVSFRGNVYNLKQGKINRKKVKKKSGFVVDNENNWRSLSFAFPEVAVGSLVEFTYTIVSDFTHHLPSWSFQRMIPVEHSEFNISLPGFYKYLMRFRGHEKLTVNKETPYTESFRVNRSGEVYGMSVDAGYFTLNVNGTKFRWVAKDLPALVIESHIDNIWNYASRMTFEQLSFDMEGNSTAYHYAKSWDDVFNYLYKHKQFGGFLPNAPGLILGKFDLKITNNFNTDVNNALNAIRNKVAWNGKSSIMAQRTIDEVLEKGYGNSAEINLLLCTQLQNMGIEAYPVVMSTVDNIKLLEHPTLSELNYVIVAAFDQDGNYILLDATEPLLPMGYLPLRAINGKGRLLHRNKNMPIELKNPDPEKVIKNYYLTISESGNFEGKFEIQKHNYSSYLASIDYKEHGEEYFFNKLENNFGVEVTDFKITLPEKPGNPFLLTGSLKVDGLSQFIGNEIIFQPLLFETLKEHDFRQESRKYPIELFVTSIEEINIEIELPDNIRVSGIPAPKKVVWGKNFLYNYEITKNGNKIIIKTTESIMETTIDANRYSGIVDYLEHIITKHKEPIVLEITQN
jgi:hypothetical protein